MNNYNLGCVNHKLAASEIERKGIRIAYNRKLSIKKIQSLLCVPKKTDCNYKIHVSTKKKQKGIPTKHFAPL